MRVPAMQTSGRYGVLLAVALLTGCASVEKKIAQSIDEGSQLAAYCSDLEHASERAYGEIKDQLASIALIRLSAVDCGVSSNCRGFKPDEEAAELRRSLDELSSTSEHVPDDIKRLLDSYRTSFAHAESEWKAARAELIDHVNSIKEDLAEWNCRPAAICARRFAEAMARHRAEIEKSLNRFKKAAKDLQERLMNLRDQSEKFGGVLSEVWTKGGAVSFAATAYSDRAASFLADMTRDTAVRDLIRKRIVLLSQKRLADSVLKGIEVGLRPAESLFDKLDERVFGAGSVAMYWYDDKIRDALTSLYKRHASDKSDKKWSMTVALGNAACQRVGMIGDDETAGKTESKSHLLSQFVFQVFIQAGKDMKSEKDLNGIEGMVNKAKSEMPNKREMSSELERTDKSVAFLKDYFKTKVATAIPPDVLPQVTSASHERQALSPLVSKFKLFGRNIRFDRGVVPIRSAAQGQSVRLDIDRWKNEALESVIVAEKNYDIDLEESDAIMIGSKKQAMKQ